MESGRGTSASWRCAGIGESGVAPLFLASSSVRHHGPVGLAVASARRRGGRGQLARRQGWRGRVPLGAPNLHVGCMLANWHCSAAALVAVAADGLALVAKLVYVLSLHDKMSTRHIIPFRLWRADETLGTADRPSNCRTGPRREASPGPDLAVWVLFLMGQGGHGGLYYPCAGGRWPLGRWVGAYRTPKECIPTWRLSAG